ncbi:MAG: Transglycosylase-associated protein [Verrucomicrobiaceae bacterium]|nr:Transglycosylase-associated protein [Verrucomicrobiaceae bacterium]
MSIIGMIVIGLIVGALAKMIMPGRDPGGIIVTIIIGIVGSIIAGFLGRSLGWYHDGEPVGFIASVVGSIILLALYRMISGRGRVV